MMYMENLKFEVKGTFMIGEDWHPYSKVIEAPNAEIAELMVRDLPSPVDLLVTDVVMPRVGGIELADRLRSRFPQMRVLFMTGYSGEEMPVRPDSPRFCVMQKPFKPAEVADVVRSLLQQ